MLGAIGGDIIGSVYEFQPIKSVDFPHFSPGCSFTDDTVLTAAVAETLLEGGDYASRFVEYFWRYPDAGYGAAFFRWAANRVMRPYGSFGNGSAMRVSPVGWAFDTLDETLAEARRSAAVTHDHPAGIRGAQAVAAAIFLARTGSRKPQIQAHIVEAFGYDLETPLDAIRPVYTFDETCQDSVPPSLRAFLESEGYEDAVRRAVSLGGDADTMACIAGSIAEAYYGGVPEPIAESALALLDQPLRDSVLAFRDAFACP